MLEFVKKLTLFSLIFIIGLMGFQSFAAQSGKIAGKVVNAVNGAPLSGANVTVAGTRLGASTDLEGEFYIINVPTGVYDVSASVVGCCTQTITGVVVTTGSTVRLEFKLEEAVIEMEEVIVTFQKPPVDIKETSMRSVVRAEDFEELPVQTVDQMLEVQAGFVSDANGDLHLRGGRSGEIVYYIDGQRIENPVVGGTPPSVNREAVEEMSVLSGTFNAEYGDAMSGVVQMITKEGSSEKLNIDFEYTSPMLNESPYRKADWVEDGSDAIRDSSTGESLYHSTNVSDEPDNVLPFEGRTHLSLNGPVPYLKNTTFFLSSVVNNENTHLPFGFDQERTLQGKIAFSPNRADKFTISGAASKNIFQNYNHRWKYVPEHYHKHFVDDNRMEVGWTHQFSESAFFNLRGGVHEQGHLLALYEDWNDYLVSGYEPKDVKLNVSIFYDEGDWSDDWEDTNTLTYSAGGDFTYQYSKHHQFKFGAEGRSFDIESTSIREMEILPDGSQGGVIDYYSENPFEFSTYIQDKIELDYLVVNAGVRWDYVDPNSEGWADPENPDSALVSSPSSQQISPRLGLAHPISDDVSLYFAYGHFFQFPHYYNLFAHTSDLNPDTLANRSFDFIGNRSLKPQKTVAYEVGLKGNVSRDVGFTVTAYYKDITDLVGTKQVRVGAKYNYAIFRNIDYASVIGFEIGLKGALSQSLSFDANYAYSVAKGNSSEPTQGFWDVYTGQPEIRQEYYLDFDRTHVFNAMAIWRTRHFSGKPGYSLINWLKSDINLGIIMQLASGLPYTPYTGIGEALAEPNSERMDMTASVDIRFSKILYYNEPIKISMLVYVDNFFDFTNGLIPNTQTGEPWEAPLVSNEFEFDANHDPSMVDIPRVIKAGLKVEL